MPLNGSDVASKPTGTTAQPNTVIESSKYNSTIDDVYTILNTVRTLAKGFTGATTAAGAVKNFGIGLLSDKSANYTGVLADLGKIFRFTATATLSLEAASTLGNGWWCIVWGNGGAVTVDPNSTEQVNGGSTLTVADGDFAILGCNGTAFYAVQVDLSGYLDSSDIGSTVLAYDAQLSPLIRQVIKSEAYELVLTDSGKHILHPSADTTARTWTIPANSSVAFPIGTAITFINQDSAGVITIAITDDTMRLAVAGTTGDRTLAANGMATAVKITSTEWIISGSGLT